MIFLFILISVLSGAFVGHAATASWREQTLGSFLNIIVGMLGGFVGGIILLLLGWYTPANSFSLNIGPMLGFMIFSAVTAGILLSIAILFKRS